mmetsp:Transcript_27313/g.71464  ORF Transcript_27313/g.71464 Transcript_27313/m.71464 type:complete len:213 (+) Transcript_27313:1141-1779(+)
MVDSSLELSADESSESSESSVELGTDVEQFSVLWPCKPPCAAVPSHSTTSTATGPSSAAPTSDSPCAPNADCARSCCSRLLSAASARFCSMRARCSAEISGAAAGSTTVAAALCSCCRSSCCCFLCCARSRLLSMRARCSSESPGRGSRDAVFSALAPPTPIVSTCSARPSSPPPWPFESRRRRFGEGVLPVVPSVTSACMAGWSIRRLPTR